MQYKITVALYSNTGNYKSDITIYPLSVCGERSTYRKGYHRGCLVDEHHAAAGGRYEQIFEVPAGYNKYMLTSGEMRGVWQQLIDIDVDPATYVLPHTVHGDWKIGCNQGAVLVKEEFVKKSYEVEVYPLGGEDNMWMYRLYQDKEQALTAAKTISTFIPYVEHPAQVRVIEYNVSEDGDLYKCGEIFHKQLDKEEEL